MAVKGAFYKVYKLYLTICLVWITFFTQNTQLHLGWPTFLKKLLTKMLWILAHDFLISFSIQQEREDIFPGNTGQCLKLESPFKILADLRKFWHCRILTLEVGAKMGFFCKPSRPDNSVYSYINKQHGIVRANLWSKGVGSEDLMFTLVSIWN